MTQQDRREAYDAGVRAAAAHHCDGGPLVSPWKTRSRRGHYWLRGARRTLDALDAVMKASP
jgi:hypothetical protein